MTRLEQLKFCEVCQHRKMDMRQGLLCGLTDAKADFEGTCARFKSDEKAVVKRAEVENAGPEPISGWLAFFLWVGVGVGAFLSCLFTLIEISDLSLSPLAIVLIAGYLGSLVGVAVMTIVAFYRHQANAVSLALTYVAMIAIDVALQIVVAVMVDELPDLGSFIRSLVWVIIWFAYLLVSEKVQRAIPKETRKWKAPEKILLVIYIACCAAFAIMLHQIVSDPSGAEMLFNN